MVTLSPEKRKIREIPRKARNSCKTVWEAVSTYWRTLRIQPS